MGVPADQVDAHEPTAAATAHQRDSNQAADPLRLQDVPQISGRQRLHGRDHQCLAPPVRLDPLRDGLPRDVLELLDVRLDARTTPFMGIAGGIADIVVAEQIRPIRREEASDLRQCRIDLGVELVRRQVDERKGDATDQVAVFRVARQGLLRPLARGDVTGRGKHPRHLARGIAILRCVVKHIRDMPGHMPDGQRIVRDLAFCENLLISGAGLVRFGEITREVAADEFGARASRDGLRGLIGIGDLAFPADGHQRVRTGLDEVSRIARGLSQVGFDQVAPVYGVRKNEHGPQAEHERQREPVADR